MTVKDKELKLKLRELVNKAIKQDQALREEYQIGKKFRFIHDRLHALYERIEQELNENTQHEKINKVEILPHEVLVYVYVFNSQGRILRSWQKMLTPSVFYEYSVNRPVYLEQAHIETLIRFKSHPVQHGYITVAIDKEKILPDANKIRDSNNNPVVKVKEGSLLFEKMISFTHNGHVYILDHKGELVLKNEE